MLDRVSLDVRAGERLAIVGRSGEGKSTIADLLVRQLDPQSGAVLLDGIDLRTARLADIRRHVLVVDGEPFVFQRDDRREHSICAARRERSRGRCARRRRPDLRR